MYLVLYCHTMDDIPIKLFDTVGAASDYARDLADAKYPMRSAAYAQAYSALETDASTPVCVKVIAFRGSSVDSQEVTGTVAMFDVRDDVKPNLV